MITICLTAAFRGPSIAPPLALRTARRAKVFASGADVRLDKLLAERGAGSRKDVDRLIRKGLVELDGEVVPKNGAKLKIPYESSPIVDGFEYPPPPLLAAYHKPLGVVSTMKDDQGRSDLATVLPLNWQKSLMPVGRLDADTTGLLLFCRDGDMAHRLLHPKYVVEREYVASVEGAVDATALGARLSDGVETTEEGESLVVQAQLLEVVAGGDEADDGAPLDTVRLVVTEGKYRMVRRVLANCGHPVVNLHRVRYGEIRLGDLEECDAVGVDGDPLAWALALKEQTATVQKRAAPPPKERPAAPAAAERKLTPEEAMEEAWVPRAADVALVAEEGECSREEAAAALKLHRGDLVAALEEVQG